MDIAQEFEQGAILLDKDGLVSSPEQLTIYAMPAIEALRIDPVGMAHATAKVAIQGLDEQIVVIGYQTISGNTQVPHANPICKNL
jgi:hypothetical protein